MTDVNHNHSTDNIRKTLLSFVSEELLDGKPVLPADSLLAGGIIDSLGIVRLASFIGEEFDFQVPPEDFVIPNFGTVDAVTAYVLRHLENSAVSEQ